MRTYLSLAAAAAVAVGFSAGAPTAQAATITTNDYENVFTSPAGPPSENDCAGALGTPPNCSWDGSPMLIKFNFNDDGDVTSTELGTFASIDGSEFSFDFTNGFKWTYTPNSGEADPGITAFSVKGGGGYSVWEKLGTAYAGIGDFSDTWFPPAGLGLSHITFFDSVNPIPLPAGLVLFLSGLAGIGVLGRYKAKRRDVAIG